MSWGSRFRAERLRLKLTQGEVAARAGVGYSSVLRWEKGKHFPDPENRPAIREISEAFAALIDELPAAEEDVIDLRQRVEEQADQIAELRARLERLEAGRRRRPPREASGGVDP